MSAMKEIIKSYITLDDEIKILNKQLSSLKSEKKVLSTQIEDYLRENDKGDNSVLMVGKDVFKLIVYKKTKINKSHIESVIKEKVKNEETANDIMSELTEDTEESYLKRSTTK